MMNKDSIFFPHLHVYFHRVGDHISVFGFSVMYYGMAIALGMLLAGCFILREGHKEGMKEDDLLDVLLWGIVCGIIGARCYYVMFSLSEYRGRWGSVFNLREGGLAIFGGILGCLFAVVIVTRRKGLPFLKVADILVFGGLIGQIFGRWGNFFNREAFGGYTDGLFAMCLPVSAVRQARAVTEEMLEHAVERNGLTWISVHPTFLYESLWNIGVFLVLYFVIRKRKYWDGQVFFSYLLFYGAGRFWIEGLRTDQLRLPMTSLAISQCLAGVCVIMASSILGFHYFKRVSK